MKKNYFIYLILGFAFALTVSSCTDKYAELNRNPNELTDEDLDRDYLNSGIARLPQMQTNIFPIGGGSNDYQRMQNLMGDIYAGYFGASAYFNPPTNGCTYFLVDDWNKVPFVVSFTRVMPAWRDIQLKSQEKYPTIYAIAQILKVTSMHRITDIYGPLPYLKFGHGGLSTPYDSQQAIYQSFFADLDDAVEMLEEQITINPNYSIIENHDLIYRGNLNQWVKFANSLKLRLAMRLSYVDATNAKKYAEEAISSGKFITDNADNAMLKSIPGIPIVHPLKMIWDNYGDTRMGANMESFLVGYNDPRLPKYFNRATYTGSNAREYMGIRTGITMSSSAETTYERFSTPNVVDDTPIQWLCAAEIYFLRAEGAIRGWNMGGTAQDLYNQGITASFEQHAVSGSAPAYVDNQTSQPAAYVDSYRASNNVAAGNANLSTITIKWVESDNMERKLERIITQKWLSMFPDGQEAWSEFRRTGYPKVFPVVVNNSGSEINTATQIRRIKYPLDETQSNGIEYEKVVNNPDMLNGPDTGGTKLWWDKK